MLDTVKRPDRDLARYGARGAASKALAPECGPTSPPVDRGFLAGACHLSAAISEALHRARAKWARRSSRLCVLRAAA